MLSFLHQVEGTQLGLDALDGGLAEGLAEHQGRVADQAIAGRWPV